MAVEAPEQPAQPSPVPASKPVPTPPKARTRFGRVTIGLNVIVQLALLSLILLIINGLAYKHFKRFDFSRDPRYALSPLTRQFLSNMNKPVKLTVFMSPGNSQILAQLQTDTENLVNLYRNNQSKYVSLEMVDPFRNAARAGEIQSKYKLAQQENVVVVSCEDRSKVVKSDDLVDLDNSNEVYGQPATISAYKGEQAITNAMLEVTEGKKSSVYYVRGHGEADLLNLKAGTGAPLETLGSLLEGQHLNISDLNLLNVEAIAPDATLVMVLGPKYDFSERELKLLGDYWNKGGRVLMALNPDGATPRLDTFLDEFGVHPEDDRVLQTMSIGGGVTGIVRDVYAQVAGSTPIAKGLAGVNLVLLGSTQSFTLTSGRLSVGGTKVEPLAVAIKGFWGERDYKDMEHTGVYLDKGTDLEAPLAVAVSVEKGAVGDQRVQVGSSRLIAVGNARFLESDAMSEANASFFLSSLNWLVSREQLIGIAPRQIKSFTLNLADEQVRNLAGITALGVPALFGFLGFIVWWRRRS